jgi:agmatinase
MADKAIFLDTELTPAERDPETARFTVIPVPLEKTVSYGTGTAGGPAAILAASHELERLAAGIEPCSAGIFTEPPVDCTGPIEATMERIAVRTRAAARAGKIPVALGGEHSLTYGAVTGLRDQFKQIGIIQIDAHADLRRAYQGQKHSNASVMHLLLAAGVRLAQLGVRALSAEEVDRRKRHGVYTRDAEELVTSGIDRIELPAEFPRHVYVSFDLDGLDPSILPATGTPVPGGLGYYQALRLVGSALDGRTCVGFDVVELAPIAGVPAWDFTAAQIVYRLMGLCG